MRMHATLCASTLHKVLIRKLFFVAQCWRVSLGAFIDTDFGEVSVTLITPVGMRLQHDVIISKLDLA